MATLMDLIMAERTMPAGSPDYTLGSRRTMMQPGGQFNDAGRLGNMGMRQTLANQAPAGTSPITPGMPSPFGSLSPLPPSAAQTVPVTSPFGALPSSAFQRLPSEVLASMDERTVVPPAATLGGNYNDVFNAPYTPPAAPLPPRIPGGQTRGVREPGFFERLFQGTDFQSNNMPVTMTLPSTAEAPPQYINFGDAANAADFFRADQALMQQNPSFFGLLGGSNG